MRGFYLEEELIDIKWIFKRAFNELTDIDSENEHYFSILRLLSEGFERLFKISIAICYWEDVEKIKDKTSRTHDLEKLLDRIIGGFKKNGNLNNIKNDEILKRILAVLSYFAKYGRYFNLDIICGNIKEEDSPKSTWEGIESDIQVDFSEVNESFELSKTYKFDNDSLNENQKITKKIDELTNIFYKKSNVVIADKLKSLINEVCNVLLNSNERQAFLSDGFIQDIKIK